MKKAIIYLWLLFIVTEMSAQKSKREPRIYFPWDSLFYKNEVSLDISPVIVGLLSGELGQTESFAVGYKRFFSKGNAFRMGYRLTSRGDSYNKINDIGYEAIAPGRTDSIILVTTETYVHRWNRWQTIRTGCEHLFGKRRVKFVLGVDLLLGFEQWEEDEDIHTYKTAQPFDTSGAQLNFQPPYDPSITTYEHKALSFIIGVAPIVGVNMNLTKRWSVSGSIIFDNMGIFPFKYSDSVAEHAHQGGYNFVAAGSFIGDVSVSFHF